ncbi:MAG: hypothetical protein HY823_03185 [Acidobacteria bacterium]|nr:hypothetical protein [Acidobacteriota bacterium]
MTLTQFAMIVIGPGYDPVLHRAFIPSPAFSTTVVCVSSLEQAVQVAQALVRQGIQLIELCGGFLPEQAAFLHESVDRQIPVGVVRYSPEEQQQLSRLFGESASSSSA